MIPLGGPRACPACHVLHLGRTCDGVIVVAPVPDHDPAVVTWSRVMRSAR